MGKTIPSVPILEIDDNEVTRNKRGIPWVRLIDALSKEGCPICHAVLRSAHEHLDNLLYENVNDVSVRMKLHASFGFCNYHAQLACEVERELHSDGQHLGTIHVSLLHAELGFLEEALKVKRPAIKKRHSLSQKVVDPIVEKLTKDLQPTSECLICEASRHTEDFYISQCTLMCNDDEFRSLYEQKTILLCRTHFFLTMQITNDAVAIDYFVLQQHDKLRKLHAQLELFLDKHDVKYKNSPYGEEGTSWLKVVEHFSSEKGVVLLNR